MNISYLDKAKERINNVPLLINMVSRRVRQLMAGQRPLVKPDSHNQPPVDIALKEIAEGKFTTEIAFDAPRHTSSPDSMISLG